MQKLLPTVAIVGRPNVGKSTLFNAFVGAKKAIVSDISGTTRDNVIERVNGEDINYLLVDTAGLTDGEGVDLEERIQTQAEIASQESDLVIFLIDAKAELTLDDREVAENLRRGKAPVVFCANKVDDGNESTVWNLLSLGLGDPHVISAKNYIGVRDLEDFIEKTLLENPEFQDIEQEDEPTEEDGERIKIALIGRPNVGKSSLLNKLLGQERSIVSNVPGTTRDTIDVKIEDKEGNKFLLLDTAGLRRPGKFSGKNKNALKRIEFWSTVRTARAIEQADVCAFLLDSLEGVTHQDLAILGKALDAEKGIIICVNKFDLAIEKAKGLQETDERELDEVPMWHEEVGDIRGRYITYLTRKMKFLSWASVVFMSAKTGKGVKDVYKEAKKISEERVKRISTGELNRFLPEMVHGHVLPSVGTKFGKIKFLSQVSVGPPKFIVHTNNVAAFHATYRRYVENKIRERYGFQGTPILVEFRDSMDKFKGGKKIKKRTGKPRPGRHSKFATERDPNRGANCSTSSCEQ